MIKKKENQEILFKEIDLIQAIISRMASNSFMIKSWTVTLVAATLLLKGSDKIQVWIAFIPIIAFWILDAYYLWQERMYRILYNWLIENRLTSSEHILDMNAYRFKTSVQSIPRIMISFTLGWFYGVVAILVLIFSFFILFSK
jgi:hypothetical protein